MRIDHLSRTAPPGPRAPSGAFRAGRAWLPLATGHLATVNPDSWSRQRQERPATDAADRARAILGVL